MRGLIPLAMLLSLSPVLAHAAGPEALPDRFIAAWNAHDPKAFEQLYQVDAVWVPIAEERTEGREAIVSEFAKVHVGGWAAKTTITKKDAPEVHLLRPDVATIFFHMDFLKDGAPVPGLQRALILVATAKDGDWKIAAGQLTKESPAR
ncbi:SgcJ/EcaC family oxidoreductase [Caulobacter hibisci]|uniref:SgcJ/EcaC family oxidoreductase n=1 Tax=Caulobacter hibisci TaxID=2035993 RepID=A0ABS0T2S3_9CAUL|nr:SgcJ/EcaC family oxidoreductase [Caulobacter hibisci]MBI1686186.1 SgcJ/EcaC family oxidoreductase [Caulobacter hibisci]